jgi:hypothetical protein
MNRFRIAAFTTAAVMALGWITSEVIHVSRYGHLVPFGLHGDVTVTQSDDILAVKGTANIYRAHFTNYGPFPVSLTVCDYLNYAGMHDTMANYIVERWDGNSKSWKYVREMDEYGSRIFCLPSFEVTATHLVTKRIWPGQSVKLGEFIPAFAGGLQAEDAGRFTLFLAADGNGHKSISTGKFCVDRGASGGAAPVR